jgi:hypothetical protein
MTIAPQVAMRKASQMWQVFFPSQTLHVFFFLSQNLQIFSLALCKKAQYVVVNIFMSNKHRCIIKSLNVGIVIVSELVTTDLDPQFQEGYHPHASPIDRIYNH